MARGLAAVLVLLPLLVLPGRIAAQNPEPAAAGGAWPFGKDPRAGGRAALPEKDLFNLGALGAKVRDADREPTSRTSGRMVQMDNPDRKDQGPSRLLVELLFPGGPAEKAGLRVGDIVTGVNGRAFEKGSLGPIAEALVKARAVAKGVVSLDVERPGAKGPGPVQIKVAVAGGGPDAAHPLAAKERRAVAAKACDWLAERQQDDGGFAATLSGTNGAVVQAALAGLAWLGSGEAKREPAIDKAVKFVLRYIDAPDPMARARPEGANWNQTNWGYVHAGLFLAELQARRPAGLVKKELQRIADEIGKRQEASGGWGHGPGGRNALGYVELNIVSGLALSALGAARQAGCTVDKAVIDKALAYLEASGGGDGGVGYSTEAGQKGQGNIGRTAAAWLGAENLGLGAQPFVLRMKRYVGQYAGDVLGGHASLMQHILLAGVAAQALGGEAAKAYWDAVGRDLVLARAPDGSFQPRPWAESLSMGSNSDVSFGEVWTTSAWTIVLVADPREVKGAGLPVWTGQARSLKRG